MPLTAAELRRSLRIRPDVSVEDGHYQVQKQSIAESADFSHHSIIHTVLGHVANIAALLR
jgi:hypothetical protein